MKYVLTEEGIKTLSLLPKDIQRRILGKLDFLFKTEDPLKFSKRLNNFEYGGFRMRMGNYRASFDVKNNTAIFLRFGHRRDMYK